MHHDMRLFLSALSVCLEEENIGKAKEMLSSYSSHIDNARLKKYCSMDTINYILSDFEAKCTETGTGFEHEVKIDHLAVDVNMFSSILSNALDNALDAQKELPQESRSVRLMLKGKLLLSVENPIAAAPRFADGLPVSKKEGHGYGTQSIRYMTERLGGKWQFSVKESTFILKVII